MCIGFLLVALFAFSVLISKPAHAATGVNQYINFQGRLLNAQGATVGDGFYNIEFKIYQDGDGQTAGNATGTPSGSLKWTEDYLNANSQGVKVVNGYLSVQLGSINAFGSNIDWNQDKLWLSMNIGSTNGSCTPFSSCSPDGEMVPMQRMTSAPYALNSGMLDGKTSSQFVQLAQGLQTDASNVTSIAVNKTGSGNIMDLQASGNSVFVLSNTGAATFTSSTANGLLVRNSSGTSYLSVDTSNGTVNLGVTGITSSNSTIHIADSSNGVQTVTIGSTSSTSTTTIKAGSGGIGLTGNVTIAANNNFTQSGTGTFSTGSGTNTLNGDVSITANKNFTQNGTGTFATGSGTNTLNGDTTVAGTKNFTVNGGNTVLGANLDVTGSAALKKGTDFSTTGTTNNANFGSVSLVRLTGASAQTITGIAGGRDGYLLTIVNAGAATATITNNDSNSTAANRITTGGGNISLTVGSNINLVYDSGASLWRANSGNTTSLQNAYNNSTSPQITLSTSNGGLVVQDASSAIGADLFTVQSNGGATKYFNVDATTVAISDNLTVTGTYNTNTFNSTSLQFGGASGSVSSTGNLTIQAGSSNSLILDTTGSGTISLAGTNATTVNVATSNVAHNVNIGTGGTSAAQTIAIGSSGNVNSSITLNAGSTGGITLNGNLVVSANNNITQSGTGSFSTGSGAVSLNGDTSIAANHTFTQNGTGSFSTGSGTNTLNGDTSIAANKNFTQNGTGTFSTGSGTNTLNGDTSIAANKNFTQNGTGTFSTGSGTNTLNGDTTVAGTKNFTVNGGNTVLGANLDVTGSTALKKGTDFSTTGTSNNVSFGNASLIRLTGASAQTITGIANGRDGYVLTLVNAGNNTATLTNNDSNSGIGNRILTGTGSSVSLLANATITLVYDSTTAVWRAGSATHINNLQTAYDNSSSPQITLSSANGGLVVQDASSAIGADLFTVQSNGGATKYFNIDANTVAIDNDLTVTGTYNSNTFTSTSLAFGGASGSVSSTGNLTIQAGSSNSLILDTSGTGTISLGSTNAGTINVAANNVTHTIHIGDGGTSAAQTIAIGSSGNVNSSITLNAGSTGGVIVNGNLTVSANNNITQSGSGSFSTGSGAVSLNGDTSIAANHTFTQNGTGSFSTGSGTNTLNGDTSIAANKNFTQNGTGTFSTGSGTNTLNGDTSIAANKNFTQNGTGTFSTGSGTNTLNGDTTVAGTKNFTVNGGNTVLGANLDVTGSAALKKGTDFSTTGQTDNASFSNASLIRLTGASAQTITGIAGGRDGYLLTLVNAGSAAATITNNDSSSSAGNRILTGTGNSVTLAINATVTLVYDSASAVWRAGSAGGNNNLQNAYNNSTSSPQITLSSANGGIVVQDASSAIGAALFTVQSNGGATKYFNVDATTVAISYNLTVTGTYNTNTFTSTSLAFGGATGSVSSSGNLTIQAGSSNSLILDTSGTGTVSLGSTNAGTINVAANNVTHTIHIGDGGTSAAQTIAIGSTGNVNSSITLNAGSTGGITLNGNLVVSANNNITQSGTGSFSTGSGAVSLNGDVSIAANHTFTQNGTGTFSTGSGTNTLNGDTSIAANKNFTQNGTGTFSTGSGTNTLNGDTSIAANKNFTQNGTGTFSTGSGINTLNGDTTVAGTKNFTVNGGNTVLGANLDVTGSTALKKGTDFSTTGQTDNASFANASLIRLTGASAQTITGIAGGRDGYLLTLVNAGSNAAIITNNDSNSSPSNRILTGTGNSITLAVNATVTLVYDSTTAAWRAGSAGGNNNLQNAYNNSTSSPQITLSSANGGLVVQDASSAIGAALFTVQSNGGATKYLNIDSSTVAISDNVTVSGTYNTNTFTSTSLAFGGATGSVSSTGNLTIQAGSTNSLLLDTGGAGTVAIASGNAATVNIATNNATHAINIGTGGTSAAQTIAIGSTGNTNSAVTINAGTSGGITLNAGVTIAANNNFTQSGTGAFSTGSGSNTLNGDVSIAANHTFTQNGTGAFTTGSGTNTLSGDTVVAGTHTFATGSGTVSLNGDTTVATNKAFNAYGASLFKDASNSASAFQVQNNSSFNVMAVDTSANHLKVYDGTATQAYVDIYYDDATTSAVIAASTGTTKIGNGSGPIALNAGAGSAVTILGHAASSWALDAGNLTVDVTGAGQTLGIGTGANAKTINIGNGTGATAVTVTCGTGTCTFGATGTDHSTTIGSTTGTSLTTIQAGSGGIALSANTTVTANNNFTQSGSGTFTTGTGLNTLSGNTVVASGMTFTANGTSLFQNNANSVTSFQIQNAAGSQMMNVDTSTTPNLVVSNPDFEGSSVASWVGKLGTETVARSTATAYQGNASLSVTEPASAAANSGVKYSYALSATTTYALSAYVKTQNTTIATFQLGYSENGSTDTSCSTGNTATTTSWARVTCTFTTGDAAPSSSYIYLRDTTGNVSKVFYVDAVQLEVKTNLLTNPGVESTLGSEWVGLTNTNVARSATAGHFNSGAAGLDVTPATTGTNRGAKSVVTLSSATTYTLVLYAKDPNATAAGIEIGRSEDGTNFTSCATGKTINTTFAQLTCTFTTGATSGSTFVYIRDANSRATSAPFYVDSIQLYASDNSAASAFQNGTIALNGVINSPISMRNQVNSTTAFQLQNAAGANVMVVDSTNKYLKIYENNGSTNYALIYYDSATTTANYTANSGTVAVGAGAGAITMVAGSGSSITITANASSVWRTTAGTLTLQAASGQDLLLSPGSGGGLVNINVAAGLKLGSNAGDLGTCTAGAVFYNTSTNRLRGCQGSTPTWNDLVATTNTLQQSYTASTGGTTPEIKLGTTRTALDIQDADSTIAGPLLNVRASNGAGLGTAMFSVGNTGDVTIQSSGSVAEFSTTNTDVNIGSGNAAHSTNPITLVLDNYQPVTAGAEPTQQNGAMYYDDDQNAFRCGVNGFWNSCAINSIESTYVFEDEFLGGNSNSTVGTSIVGVGDLGWNVTSTTSCTESYNQNVGPGYLHDHPGVLKLTTGAASGNGCAMTQGGTTATGVGTLSQVVASGDTFKANIAITAATGTFRIGWTNRTDNSSAPTSGAYWQYTGGNLQYCYANNTTAVCATATTLAINTWAEVEIHINSTSNITFTTSIGGVTTSNTTSSAFDPGTTNKLGPGVLCYASTTTAQSCLVDYIQWAGINTSGDGIRD